MDSLRRAFLQLHALWRSLPPGSRMAAGLLAAAMLLGLGYLGTRPAPGPDADLMHGVPVAVGQLPAMVSAFAKANLKGYEIRGTSILVPRGEEPAYLAALAEAKALPNLGDATAEAAKLGGPFTSSRDREELLKNAKQAELALMIGSMKGIESAYVIYDIDSKRGSFGNDRLITATVSVKPAGSAHLDEAQVSAIRHLVAGAIAGLKPENVTVSDRNGPIWYGNTAGDPDAEENLYASLKRTYEQDLKAKILSALCFIPNVTAEASVEFDRRQITRMKQGRPAAQLPNTATTIGASSGECRNENETTEPQGPTAPAGGLTPVSARVSVGVPASYLKMVWHERHTDPPGQYPATPDAAALEQISVEESAKIRRHVAQLLPPTLTPADPMDQVRVTTFEDLQPPEAPLPTFAEQAWSWLAASWRTVGLLGLALVCLLGLLRMAVRGGRAAKGGADWQAAFTSPEAEPVEGDPWQPASRVPSPHWRRPAVATGGQPAPQADPALRREVSELVEADPETAAGILRNWIGQAS